MHKHYMNPVFKLHLHYLGAEMQQLILHKLKLGELEYIN
jgi:hypothetical protein